MQRFRSRLVFKAHGLLHHSTLSLGVVKKKREKGTPNRVFGVLPESQENVLVWTVFYVPFLDAALQGGRVPGTFHTRSSSVQGYLAHKTTPLP